MTPAERIAELEVFVGIQSEHSAQLSAYVHELEVCLTCSLSRCHTAEHTVYRRIIAYVVV